uniref:glucosaminidase domain-containing protein n=2 Tax=Limosilactobacillus fermentum TaxID=1613 RepID=UPI003A522379
YNFHYHLIWVTKYRNPVKSYTKAAWALQNNGYATDPNYANELIYAIKKFKLDQYD